MNARVCVAVTLIISAVCIAGDYFLKVASKANSPFRTRAFLYGTVIFGATSIGWVVVLRHLKLAAVGTTYGVSTVLFMALLGWLVFGESLRWHELFGVTLGLASIVLLWRFA